MAPPLLHLRDIHLTFGGTPLLQGANLMVHEGDRLCLVGRNGSGKSTLLKIVAGYVEADRGERWMQPDTTVRYLEQDPDLSRYSSIREYVLSGLSPGDSEHPAERLLEALNLNGDTNPASLSGGERRRGALARALAPAPDILLLDEPTNHLDLPTIEWLENEIAAMRAAVVLISHDRRFLENTTRRTVWLDRGTTRNLDDGFAAFEAWRDDLLEQEELEQHKLDRKIVREEHWLTYGVTARRKRNVRRLKELDILRQTRREAIKVPSTADLKAFESDRSGKVVIEAQDIAKSYTGRPLVNGFDIRINRGDKVGFTGANGTGKTTLLKLLIGDLVPDQGEVKLGTNLEILTVDQLRANLRPNVRLADALTSGRGDAVMVGGKQLHVMSYLQDFLFLPEQARSPVSALSGGEKGRLALAIAFARPSNLLVLDEPTNDLDLETLDLLQELLSGYSGTILLVSHDRDFLDRTVTSVVAPSGDGKWTEYAGGYSDMIRQSAAGDEPKKQTPPAPSKKGSKVVHPRTNNNKLSFKEQHALKTLPEEIEDLQDQIARLQQQMSNPAFYSDDPEGFATSARSLKEAEKDLGDKEELWLELELKREEIGQ